MKNGLIKILVASSLYVLSCAKQPTPEEEACQKRYDDALAEYAARDSDSAITPEEHFNFNRGLVEGTGASAVFATGDHGFDYAIQHGRSVLNNGRVPICTVADWAENHNSSLDSVVKQ